METRPGEPLRLASQGWRVYALPGVCFPILIDCTYNNDVYNIGLNINVYNIDCL